MKAKESKLRSGASKQTERLWFDELSMKEAEESAKAKKVVIIPVGSVEEHGDHLTLCLLCLVILYVVLVFGLG
jgi:hypothetical protein